MPWSMHAAMLLAAATWRRATPASGARRGERAVCASSGSCWWVLRGVVACALAEARVFAEALLAAATRRGRPASKARCATATAEGEGRGGGRQGEGDGEDGGGGQGDHETLLIIQ